ncbi:amino acid ABC transporter permease [Paenibacillus sp. GSMTC-2017]|uniref:amino acid ABC transporter permease n=1 Tax=Paenibacillus sp. GSMTC-2017 TaxID=2794350 RepID=UPI0018D60895|nr:amino acid ABC transporter permease [Paenibacillus sp. GSMTC-2017]MBH5318732.1 amino acid ABC transporter permease [Paenibacillus sp. GSMTC-2017]
MFDLAYLLSALPRLLQFMYLTVTIAVLAITIGLILGLLLETAIRRNMLFLSTFSKIYISFFRATPLLVQLFILYYGIPQVFPAFGDMNAYTATVIGISLNCAAYLAEIIRAAIRSIDYGQWEACQSIGMTRWQSMRRIILPQALRIALPSFGNTFVTVIKETSLGFTLGLTEMMAQAKLMAADTYKFLEAFLAAAILYWLVAIVYGYIQTAMEKRVNRPYGSEV